MSLRLALHSVVRVVRRRAQQQLGPARQAPARDPPISGVHLEAHARPRGDRYFDVTRSSHTNLAGRASNVWRLSPGPRLTPLPNGSRSHGQPSSYRPLLPILFGFAGVGLVGRGGQNAGTDGGMHPEHDHSQIDLESAIALVKHACRDEVKPEDEIDSCLKYLPADIGAYAFSRGIIAKGAEGVVYAAKQRDVAKVESGRIAEADGGKHAEGGEEEEDGVQIAGKQPKELTTSDEQECDLAVKMMFNYDLRSSSTDIMSEFQAEVLPLVLAQGSFSDRLTPNCTPADVRVRSYHPNIVRVYKAFVDRVEVPCLDDALLKFDVALPAHLNPMGCGAEQTMYIVMKRYRTSLRDYLRKECRLSDRVTMLIVAQLLEAVAYLGSQGVVHRDLKTNNILMEYQDGDEVPTAVVADFGCALSLRGRNVREHITSNDPGRRGNTALMAPELKKAFQRGNACYSDFLKADVWAVGAIAYEVCGQPNPFYSGLDSGSYGQESLPPLATQAVGLKLVVQLLLEHEPGKRPSAQMAADILHLFLWQPCVSSIVIPSSSRCLEGVLSAWIIRVSLTHLFHTHLVRTSPAVTGGSSVEHGIVGRFLRRASSEGLLGAAGCVAAVLGLSRPTRAPDQTQLSRRLLSHRTVACEA